MTTPKERQRALTEVLEQRVLVLDGAMGTMLQQRNLTAADFGGPALEGCNENLVRTRPDVVLDIHRAYFAAGADMVETNTFGATPLVLAEYGIEPDAYELNRARRPTGPPGGRRILDTGQARASSPAPWAPPPRPSPWSAASHFRN